MQRFYCAHKYEENILIVRNVPSALSAIFSIILAVREQFCAKQLGSSFYCRNFASQLSYRLNLAPHANIQLHAIQKQNVSIMMIVFQQFVAAFNLRGTKTVSPGFCSISIG